MYTIRDKGINCIRRI